MQSSQDFFVALSRKTTLQGPDVKDQIDDNTFCIYT